MSAYTKHQIIEKDGTPIFVVVPYKEYIELVGEKSIYIPHEIIEKKILEGKSIIRSWREYINLSQDEIAKRMKISQAAYSQMEKPGANLRKKTLQRIAVAMDIDIEQLT